MRGQRGLVLVGALVLIALLVAASGAGLWLTRSELWAAGNARAWLQARYSAESGAAHAVALLAPGTDFAPLLARTGGLIDAARPGPLPLAGGGFVAFPGAPFGYSVTPAAAAPPPAGAGVRADERVVLLATATAVRGATRTVVATVGRAIEPYAPAALIAADDALWLSGDAAASPAATLVDASAPAAGAQATLGVRSAVGAAAVAALGLGLVGAHPTALVQPIDVAALARGSGLPELAAAGQAVALGSDASPQAARLAAGEVAGIAGTGALVAAGPLAVRGSIALRGVLLVEGRLTLAAPSCAIEGMVWAREIELVAPCQLRFDEVAIGRADTALRLARRAVLLALTDR